MLWLLTTVASLLAAFYIAAPFVNAKALRPPAGAPLRQKKRDLEARRETLLRELKDLELDRRMGKVEADEYAGVRARVTQEAAQVLGQLEALSAPEAAPRAPQVLPARRAALEAEVEIEVAVARARRKLRAATWECQCGRVMKLEDRFCASCGAPRPARLDEPVAPTGAKL